MSKLFKILVLMICVWGAEMLASQPYAQPPVDSENYRWGAVLKSINYNTLRKIELWKLQFHNKEFGWIDTDEIYLVQLKKKEFEDSKPSHYPIIIQMVTGHSASLNTLDLDQDGTEEILFTYHAGANQTILRVFLETETSIMEAKGPAIASNMASIKLVGNGNGYNIVFTNSEYIKRDRVLSKKTLHLKNGILISK